MVYSFNGPRIFYIYVNIYKKASLNDVCWYFVVFNVWSMKYSWALHNIGNLPFFEKQNILQSNYHIL